MSQILVLFVVDGASKLFLALASILLIRYLTISDFAKFSIIFTIAMMAYQVASGVVERLYLSDYAKYREEGGVFCLIFLIGGGVSIYTYVHADLYSAVFSFVLVAVCTNYQVLRIKKQREERFAAYALVDMVRNLVWLLLLCASVFFSTSFGQVDMVNYALVTFVVLTMLASLLLQSMSEGLYFWLKISKINYSALIQTIKYYVLRKDVFLYSILGGVIPYYPFISATIMGDESLISTYGAAMRYQAIFSMAILAVNTVVVAKFCNDVGGINRHSSLFYRVLPLVLLFLISAAFVICYFIPYVDGGKYPALQSSFIILSMCSAVSLVSTVAVNKLLAFNNYRSMLKSVIYGFLLMIFLTPIFTHFSYELGPLLSVLLGYTLVTMLLIISASKEGDCESIDS